MSLYIIYSSDPHDLPQITQIVRSNRSVKKAEKKRSLYFELSAKLLSFGAPRILPPSPPPDSSAAVLGGDTQNCMETMDSIADGATSPSATGTTPHSTRSTPAAAFPINNNIATLSLSSEGSAFGQGELLWWISTRRLRLGARCEVRRELRGENNRVLDSPRFSEERR